MTNHTIISLVTFLTRQCEVSALKFEVAITDRVFLKMRQVAMSPILKDSRTRDTLTFVLYKIIFAVGVRYKFPKPFLNSVTAVWAIWNLIEPFWNLIAFCLCPFTDCLFDRRFCPSACPSFKRCPFHSCIVSKKRTVVVGTTTVQGGRGYATACIIAQVRIFATSHSQCSALCCTTSDRWWGAFACSGYSPCSSGTRVGHYQVLGG